MERWRDRWRCTGGGEAAQLRENEDCLLGIGGGRASLGVMVFRWASGLPPLVGSVHCYGIALPFPFILPHLCNYKSLDTPSV